MRLTRWQQKQQPEIDRELRRAVDALRRLGAERVILFGSHARGDFNEASAMVLSIWQQHHWSEVEPELARIVERLASYGAERVVLYGSYARGGFHTDSDVDLLIVKDTDESRRHRRENPGRARGVHTRRA